MTSTARRWWESRFPWSNQHQGRRLPDPFVLTPFWAERFPPLTLLNGLVDHTDAYWKRLQKILSHIYNDVDIPCPFTRFQDFIEMFYEIQKQLDYRSTDQLIRFLEIVPHSHEPNIFLWDFPITLADPLFFLELLVKLSTENHWIWNAMMNTSGATEIFFDRMIIYLEPVSYDAKYKEIEAKIAAVNLLTTVISHKPPEPAKFNDMMESYWSRMLQLLARPPVSIQVEAFRSCKHILEKLRNKFGTEQLVNFVERFVQVCCVSYPLKTIAAQFIASYNALGYTKTKLARDVLKEQPDHNDIEFVSELLSVKSKEKPLSIVQTLVTMAAFDKRFSRTCCYALPPILLAFDSQIPWLNSFIKKATGFIIISRMNYRQLKRVPMILDLFVALYSTQLEWIMNELSNAAALLLASQNIPLAYANLLKPSIRTDKKQLQEWLSLASKTDDIKSLLRNVKEEGLLSPKLPPSSGGNSYRMTKFNSKPCQSLINNKRLSKEPVRPTVNVTKATASKYFRNFSQRSQA